MERQLDIRSEEFVHQVAMATDKARRETLANGVPVFYAHTSGIDVMEMPDGRMFEIRYIPGAPGPQNYEVLRQVASNAA